MEELKRYLSDRRKAVDEALMGFVTRKCPSRLLSAPLEHSLMAGGKRLRPVLCIAAAETVGGQMEAVMPAACAIEMIHTYSLVHDDLPAMDDDELRRGQPTCHIQFDEATAILCGDTLLNMAYEILTEAGLNASAELSRLWLKAANTIADAAGCNGMLEGQARDITYEGVQISRDDLQNLHELKTGALIRASVCSGAQLGGASEKELSRLEDYAQLIGLAFQVVDDILNITGDPDKLGKAVGTDAHRQKNTYPALMGLDASREFADELIDRALQALSIFDNKATPLRNIARYIIDRNR